VTRCPHCGHENRPQAKFCEECAAPLARRCANCGSELTARAKFCPECAHPTGVAATTSTPRFASPDSYTPKHLAERILTSKAALEGERKQVTVLFADLKGSMELLADRDPEEARKLLDPVLERMMEAVHRYEGTVNQVMGDGIMALFGAPLAHEDHAVRACYAALRMQESVKRYAEGVRRVEGVPIRIRVGLNSGEVVVRAVGSDLHMDYTAVGQTTHLAARMEQLAEPGTALLTPATLALCEDFVQVKSLGLMRVKGLAEPMETYELTGANPVRSRFHAQAARGLTKFVGRTNEMVQLGDALDLARRGRGQVVAVVGEPGVGKSRLFWEFTHSHRTTDCLVLEAASVSYGKATTYFPVIELLRSYFQIEPRDDVRRIREKVTGKLLSLDRALEAALPALLAILDVPVEDEQWTRLEPSQRRQLTLDAVKHLLLRESRVQPVVVVFEDLHWIDGETQNVLEKLIESLPTARMLVLVNYRPEYQHLWGSKTYYRQLRLDALPMASAEELLEALLGRDPSLAALNRLLIERTEGNPFFLEESVRTLIETKVLAGEWGAYRLTRAPESLQIPPTAQAIIAARIDRLLPEDKRLLQASAVVGKDVPFALLQAIADDPAGSLHEGLARLQAAEFLYETQLFPEVEYTFKHALTHEVTYGSLLRDRRCALHARSIEVIETLHSERLVDYVEQLARHAVEGEIWDKAVGYLAEAGTKAKRRSAFHEAQIAFEQGLAALRHLPETRETRAHAIDLLISLRNARMMCGDLATGYDCLREAHALAKQLGDERRSVFVSLVLAEHYWLTVGDQDRAVELGEEAHAIADRLGDAILRSAAAGNTGVAHFFRGDYRRARDLLMEAVSFLKGRTEVWRVGVAEFRCETIALLFGRFLIRTLAELGEFPEALARAEEALRIAESTDQPWVLVQACLSIGYVGLRTGNLDRAIAILERGLSVCRERNLANVLLVAADHLGLAYALAGRVSEALPLLRESVAQGAAQGMMSNQTRATAWLSEGYLCAGLLDEAIQEAEQALHLQRQHKERGHEAWTLRLLGEISSHREPAMNAGAEEYYGQALVLAEELGMRPLIAHCHLGLGTLYRRTGKHEQAREHLTIATTMYREMDMRFWLEQAEAELNVLR